MTAENTPENNPTGKALPEIPGELMAALEQGNLEGSTMAAWLIRETKQAHATDRIAEACNVVHVPGRSLRVQVAKERKRAGQKLTKGNNRLGFE